MRGPSTYLKIRSYCLQVVENDELWVPDVLLREVHEICVLIVLQSQ